MSNPKSFLKNLFDDSTNKSFEIAFVENGSYINRLLGISFKIPEGWNIVQIDRFDEIKRMQKLQGIYEDFKDEIYNHVGNPLLLCTKYHPDSKDHDGIVTPTINFSVITRTEENKNVSLLEYAEQLSTKSEFGYEPIKNFRITNRGSICEYQKHNFIKYETEYLFEHEELPGGIKVEMDVINVELEDFFLDFSMTHAKEQGEVATKEFDEVINSIKIVT
jgi:hypothetical protein